MNDFAFIAILLGFFLAAALLVRACDRIIGPDMEAAAAGSPSAEPPTLQPPTVRSGQEKPEEGRAAA